jgi:hypothetical protein
MNRNKSSRSMSCAQVANRLYAANGQLASGWLRAIGSNPQTRLTDAEIETAVNDRLLSTRWESEVKELAVQRYGSADRCPLCPNPWVDGHPTCCLVNNPMRSTRHHQVKYLLARSF